jgi:hypothetical protein
MSEDWKMDDMRHPMQRRADEFLSRDLPLLKFVVASFVVLVVVICLRVMS